MAGTCLRITGRNDLIAALCAADSRSALIKLPRYDLRQLFMTLEAISKPIAPPKTRNWSKALLEMAVEYVE